MSAAIKIRVLKLEQAQPQNQTYMPLSFFYGDAAAAPVPLTPNLSISDFYQSLNKDKQHG